MKSKKMVIAIIVAVVVVVGAVTLVLLRAPGMNNAEKTDVSEIEKTEVSGTEKKETENDDGVMPIAYSFKTEVRADQTDPETNECPYVITGYTYEGEVLWEFSENHPISFKDDVIKVMNPEYSFNGTWREDVFVELCGKLVELDIYTGEKIAEIDGIKDIVACISEGHNYYVAHEGGYMLSVITTTGRVVYEEKIEKKEDVVVDVYRGEYSAVIVRADDDRTDYDNREMIGFSDMCKKSILSVEATSTLAPQGDKTYGVENLLDIDLSTVWSEGVDGSGIGEKITVKIDPAISTCAYHLSAGHQGSQELHEKNNVVKKFRVTDSTGADNVVEVYNPSELRSGQTFGVSEGAEWFTIEILEVEKGSEYDDTCISGIWFDFS